MTKFYKHKVQINKPDALSHGKKGTIVAWNHKIKKYEVSFYSGWCGWFKKKELIFYKGLD